MMRLELFCALFLTTILNGQIGVTPQNPVVSSGQSVRFVADRPVTWSLAPGSKGTITSTGIYQVSEPVTAKNQTGPCQLFPNNHIFNTRVDSLPVHTQSAGWITSIARYNARISYDAAMPLNYVADDTPTVSHTFRYTPQNNGGGFWLPPLKDRSFQNGEYIPAYADKHLLMIHPRTCDVQEVYNPYSVDRPAPANCANCTAASGAKYGSMQFDLLRGATDAAGLPIYTTTLRVEEIERALATGGSINHMIRVTLANALIAQAHVWPATAHAYPYGSETAIPYGAIFRLKASYTHPSKNPVTQLLVRQMKEHGLIVADGGISLALAIDNNVQLPEQIRAAIDEIRLSAITAGNLEAVDQSSLMIGPDTGEVRRDNPYVVPDDFAVVIATDPATGQSTRTPVALRGVTVGVPRVREHIQAGAAPKRLTAWVNGVANTGVTWQMTSSVPGASLTADGIFTPPASISSPAAAVLKVTSVADPSAWAEMVVVVLPDGVLRIATGSTSNYTDSKGNVWWAIAQANGVRYWASPADSGNNFGGHTFPVYTDYTLYRNGHFSMDMRFFIHVPNGNYRITIKMADGQKREAMLQHLESQGKLIHRNVDIQLRSGGYGLPLDLDIPAKVVDGTLWFAIRGVPPAGAQSKLSAFMIAPDPGVPELKIDNPNPLPAGPGEKRQLYAVGWFMEDGATWEIVSGRGSIDANGLYTAPAFPDHQALAVVRARSTHDPSKTADISIPLIAMETIPNSDAILTVTPDVSAITVGATQQFTAMINGLPTQDVTWTLTGRGAITQTGLYTAPADLRVGEKITITAASKVVAAVTSSVTLTGEPVTVQINAGGQQHCGASLTDGLGRVWATDTGWSGSTAVWSEKTAVIQGAADGTQALYTCGRYAYGQNNFSYTLPVPNGTYRVTLKWAEYRTKDQGYKFDVLINGVRVLTDFNFVTAAGGVRIALDRTFTTTVTDGNVVIVFDGKPGAGYNGAAINAIEIVQATGEDSASVPQQTMTLFPSVKLVAPGAAQQLAAVLNGQPTQSVTWKLTGRGTLSNTGLYKAPADFAAGESATIVAESTNTAGLKASLTVGAAAVIRVNAGGSRCASTPLTDEAGRVWAPDYGFSGASTVWSENTAIITGATTATRALYTCGRYGYREADFSYSFPVPNGKYQVTLRWAEYRATDQGYKFDVILNGTRVLEDFNFVREAGGARIAYERTFTTQVTNGAMAIGFDGKPGAGYNGAAINAIEIVQYE